MDGNGYESWSFPLTQTKSNKPTTAVFPSFIPLFFARPGSMLPAEIVGLSCGGQVVLDVERGQRSLRCVRFTRQD
jgi:hypothetical protein